jgi:hypothetical protein
MKKLISILLLFISVWCSAQYINIRKPLRLVYDGDTLDINIIEFQLFFDHLQEDRFFSL